MTSAVEFLSGVEEPMSASAFLADIPDEPMSASAFLADVEEPEQLSASQFLSDIPDETPDPGMQILPRIASGISENALTVAQGGLSGLMMAARGMKDDDPFPGLDVEARKEISSMLKDKLNDHLDEQARMTEGGGGAPDPYEGKVRNWIKALDKDEPLNAGLMKSFAVELEKDLGQKREFLKSAQEGSKEAYGVNPAGDQKLSSKLIQGATSIVPIIASGPAAPFAGAALAGESERQQAEAAGGTQEQQDKAFAANAAVGVLTESLLGVPALMRSAKAAGMSADTFQALVRSVASQFGKGAVREGAQEGVQQTAANVIAKEISGYDPNRGTFEGVPEAVLLGAAVGAPTGAVFQAAASLDQRAAIQPEVEAVASRLEDVDAPRTAEALREQAASQATEAPLEVLVEPPVLAENQQDTNQPTISSPPDVAVKEASAIYEPSVEISAVSQEALPKHLRADEEVERLINDPEFQMGPQMRLGQVSDEAGSIFPRVDPAVTPKGSTPKGDTEFLKIPRTTKRFPQIAYEGAADVVGRTRNRVGKLLSKAIRRHVDLEQEIFGQLYSKIEKTIASKPAKVQQEAFDELAPYIAARENGRPVPALSADAQSILTAWEDIAEQTGLMSEAHKVQVFDPILGKHRPIRRIGRNYIPRVIKTDAARAMSDPENPKNAALFNDLVDALAADRGITTNEAAAELRKEATRFSSTDFMGNIERARVGQLPEIFYEYDLRKIASRYIPQFSERMAQIISYGQRLGSDESPSRPNLWDIARAEGGDAYSQNWLREAEDQAVNRKASSGFAKAAVQGQTLANAMLLSSPTTSVVRNMISGVTSTTEILGIGRSLKPLIKAVTDSQAGSSAREIGAVRDNLADFLHADQLSESVVDEVVRSITSKALKFSGYNGSETFVRTHAALTASQFAKDAVAELQSKPTSGRAKEALAIFKRMGLDAQEIVNEEADWKDGPETRKFIRTIIRESQGGYRFDQVPLWANSAVGRFFYQYGRYGTQRARSLWKNGVLPIIGTEIEWNGKKMVRRDFAPLIKMGISSVLLGEAFALIAAGFFDRDRKDASLAEIAAAWKEDEKTAIGLALQRALNDIIMAGTLGIWGQPVDFIKTLKDQSRFKNPAEPPSLASTKAIVQLATNAMDQGGRLTTNDMLSFASSFTPGVKQLTDVARNVFDEPLYEAQNDVRTLRTAAQRWAKQAKLDVPPSPVGGYRKSEFAPEYEAIQSALLEGDSDRAKQLERRFITSSGKTEEAREKAKQGVRASVRSRQPFRVGPYTGEEHRKNFMEWAEKNLSSSDLNQVKRVQERYLKAARSAGLMD